VGVAIASGPGFSVRSHANSPYLWTDVLFGPNRGALVSVREDDGAVIVHDATVVEEVERLAMGKPSGKSNAWNKIAFADGTGH